MAKKADVTINYGEGVDAAEMARERERNHRFLEFFRTMLTAFAASPGLEEYVFWLLYDRRKRDGKPTDRASVK